MKLKIEVSFHKHHLIMSFPYIIYSGMFNVRRGIYHFDKIYYPSSVVENEFTIHLKQFDMNHSYHDIV